MSHTHCRGSAERREQEGVLHRDGRQVRIENLVLFSREGRDESAIIQTNECG